MSLVHNAVAKPVRGRISYRNVSFLDSMLKVNNGEKKTSALFAFMFLRKGLVLNVWQKFVNTKNQMQFQHSQGRQNTTEN